MSAGDLKTDAFNPTCSGFYVKIILGFPPVYGGNAKKSQNFLSSQMPCHAITECVQNVRFNWPIKVYDAACERERKSRNGSNLQIVRHNVTWER